MFVNRCKYRDFFINFALHKDFLRQMKHYIIYIISLFTAFFITSCGEDRTYEYVEKTQHNHWAYELLQEKYLWNETLTEPEWKSFFKTPQDFISQLASKSGHQDKWSYATVDTINTDVHQRGFFNHVESYGFDFAIITDPTGQTTKTFARVLTVYPGSPAEQAGLKRNDFIGFFDGYKVTNGNTARLVKGIARTYDVYHIAANEEEGTYYWQDTVKRNIGASKYVEDIAFPVHSVQSVMGINVGYLQCTRLLNGPEEKGDGRTLQNTDKYKNDLDAIMQDIKSKEASECVLDLRLCNDGNIDMACRLASYLVDPNYIDGVFAKTVWNENNSANNRTYHYDTSLLSSNLHLSRIYILTSGYTQGAAEWLINALRSSMGEENVVVIGQKTAGQMVMTQEIGHEYYVHLFPVVAYITDSEGNAYEGAITPTVEVNEMNALYLYNYGDINEILFHTALRMMMGE